jgi:GNAT superfamily N-acetyltransferase
MEIKIRRLTPNLLEDYLLFFDTHEDCYCVCYAATNQDGKDFSKQETRRNHAAEYVKNSLIQGYLAYANDTVVGWCNANKKSDLLKSEGWSVMLSSVGTSEADQNIKSVFCFTIAPDFRRKGISSMFLEQVCRDATDEGFYCVEAYPNKQFKDAFSDHMETADLYKKHRFVTYEETGDKIVMRKNLK